MPVKKKATLEETLAGKSPEPQKVAQRKSPEKSIKTGVSDVAGTERKSAPETRPVELSAGETAVVSSLVAQGYSYPDAVAMLSGDGAAKAPGKAAKGKIDAATQKLIDGDDSDLPPIEDVPEKFDVVEVSLDKREGFKCLLDDLWTRREEMEDVPKKTRYRVSFDIEGPEWDWLLHRTIQEGQARKDADFPVQRALTLLLKQQKALDPTRGGRRQMGSSGPKEGFNPNTGDWTKG